MLPLPFSFLRDFYKKKNIDIKIFLKIKKGTSKATMSGFLSCHAAWCTYSVHYDLQFNNKKLQKIYIKEAEKGRKKGKDEE